MRAPAPPRRPRPSWSDPRRSTEAGRPRRPARTASARDRTRVRMNDCSGNPILLDVIWGSTAASLGIFHSSWLFALAKLTAGTRVNHPPEELSKYHTLCAH
jgi:hypothetical protein